MSVYFHSFLVILVLFLTPSSYGEAPFNQKQKVDIMRKAQAGDRIAQYRLCKMYEKGEGSFSRSPEKAFHWCQIAAESGLANAQYSLGVKYYNGRGVEKNVNLAKEWFKKASEAGFGPAEGALAKIEKWEQDSQSAAM